MFEEEAFEGVSTHPGTCRRVVGAGFHNVQQVCRRPPSERAAHRAIDRRSQRLTPPPRLRVRRLWAQPAARVEREGCVVRITGLRLEENSWQGGLESKS